MKGFHIADYAVLAASLCVSLGIGVYHGCFGQKQKSAGQFLMADRDLKVSYSAFFCLSAWCKYDIALRYMQNFKFIFRAYLKYISVSALHLY